MMSLHHGWGFYLIQTASHIHIRHIQSVWAHWYVGNRHMVAALLSFILTHPSWVRFWWSGSLVELKWCHCVMDEASSDSFASHIHSGHTQSVWAHWYAVHSHTVAALLSYTNPTWLRFLVICVTARATTAKMPLWQWWQRQLTDNGHASKTRTMTPVLVQQRCQHNKGGDTSKTMAKMLAQQCWCCQHNDGKDAKAMLASCGDASVAMTKTPGQQGQICHCNAG